MANGSILVVNAGSSSLKFSLFRVGRNGQARSSPPGARSTGSAPGRA